jgi:3-oxoacyl-[acyl-carrier-protein] synthase-3
VIPVGLVDVQRYEPERFMTADQIAEASAIPADVLRERFGLAGKRIAAPDEHVSDLCIAAARPLVERNDPADIDCVAYFGSHWKDYSVWQVAPRIQDALGIEGFAFEAINVSAGAPVGLKIASDMLAADERLRSLLIVAASKESGLLDYANPRSRFMFTFGDGAVACLLRRDHAVNELLASAILTDGSFSAHVRVPAGGSVHPASRDTVAAGMHALDVHEPEEMKRRLDPITVKNFTAVARDAVERSGERIEDLNWLLPIHMKRSIHDTLVAELGVEPDRAMYLDRYGHMSAVDPLLSLCMLRDAGRLADRDLILLLAAGTGYTWAATLIRWGPR